MARGQTQQREMGEGVAPESAPAVIGHYAVMQHDMNGLQEVIQQNLGGKPITEFELDRVKVPSSGVTTWTVPSLQGEEETKAIEGVIVGFKEPRAYWKESFDASGGGTPPDCYSDDGAMGYGDPGGDCGKCPLARFGSEVRKDGSSGRGQACKQMRIFLVVRPEELLPIAIIAPPTSLQTTRKYLLHLTSKQVPYWGAVTRFELDKTKNKDGIAYSFIRPSFAQKLGSEEREKMRKYHEAFAPALERIQVAQEDVSE